MKFFLAKLTLYFELDYQADVLEFLHHAQYKNLSYGIQYIHKHEFYDYYPKNKKHEIGEYYERQQLVTLSIQSDELKSLDDWIKDIDNLTSDKLFIHIYNSVLDVFIYVTEDCFFDLSLSSKSLFVLKRLSGYLNVHYYTAQE